MSAFTKATKRKSKLRAALFGPSGSGKTFTALRIASGLGGAIAVIDTERGSASKYSDRFDFDVCDLGDKTIDGYCRTIKQANSYGVLVIDSLSHGWQELLEHVEKLAQAKYRGNTWSAWSEGTPEQRRLIGAILDFPGHVIATMRSKTEWTTAKQENGKSAPVRVGLAPEQGKGIEYEFDLLLELTVDHVCNVLKDRTGKFQDALIDKPGEDFGKQLASWLSEGSDASQPPATPPAAQELGIGSGEVIWKDRIVKNSEPVSGETRGKKWTYYKVTFDDDRMANTFSEEIHNDALRFGANSYKVNVHVRPGKKADSWELVSLTLNEPLP